MKFIIIIIIIIAVIIIIVIIIKSLCLFNIFMILIEHLFVKSIVYSSLPHSTNCRPTEDCAR